jgi:ATP-binding cassette subfamily B multidrug efflux pump
LSEAAHPAKSRKEQERALDAQANTLDLHTDVNFREAVALVWRALTYIRYFPVRYATKFFLMWLSLLTPLILPWPIKIVIDNVILQRAIEPDSFPGYFAPFVTFLDGMGPFEIMAWVLLLGIGMLITIGGFGEGGGANDQASAYLAEGHDTATKTENDANMAFSKFAGLIGWAEFRLQIRLTQSLNHLLRAQLFERIQNLPMPLLADQRLGDSLYRVMYDSTAIQNIFFQTIMSPVLAIATVFVILAVMAFNYGEAPEIIYLCFLALPVYFIAMVPFPRLIRRRSQASRAAGSVTTGNIEEGMSNVLAVQALGGNKQEQARFDRHSKESFKRFRSESLVNIFYGAASRTAGTVLGLVAFYIVSSHVIEGVLSPGDYGVLLYYYGWMSGAVSALPYAWLRLQADIPGIRRVFFLMDLPSESERDGRELHPVRDSISMEHVGFTYPDGRRALNDVSLNFKMGEITALVGPTGAGKTSLAYLLPGFHDASEGHIQFDGVDINDLSLTSLRHEVSYVFQETQLFSNSILDNIRYGNPDAPQADVERAARAAGAHDFISALPDGYETMLGTVTSKLSVGQKQRIAIARGLLKPASVLILDEPTSALDPETEAYLVQALQKAANEKLVIIIAHRLSTIAHAQNIVFLEDGELLEQGNHEMLMAVPGGHYRRFVELQTSS